MQQNVDVVPSTVATSSLTESQTGETNVTLAELTSPSAVRPIRPVAMHAIATLDRWRQHVVEQRVGILGEILTIAPDVSVPIFSSSEITPLPFVALTNAVGVTSSVLPWDGPQYQLDQAHLEAYALLL